MRTLLAHHDAASRTFLAGDQPADAGKHLGPYTLLRVLGEGGMGTVYEAEQDHPRRRVALKLIRPGFISGAMVRRFEYEADVLGRLEHPGIARVYHAGLIESENGKQPFFAMELVRGVRLDEWVKQRNPPTKTRLELLVAICDAVHHAHTKGVIHRDLKPANILITDVGSPKVLDFGVARATDSDVQATTLHTQSGQMVGTLPYMAPEQAAGQVRDLDTSSDVYALGVIAYELLSGRLPYALEDKPLHEAVRIICEGEPSRLSSIDRSLRGDVETIVRKALEKDRSRRYHTAGEFAADVKRYLDYEPIAARPPSTWYQLRRFATRNKLLVGGVAGMMLILAAGVVTSTWFAIDAQRQKREAQASKAEADAVVRFLTDDVLAGATPERLPDKPIRDAIVRVMLDPAAATVANRFPDNPMVEAAVRHVLAMCYTSLGHAELGLPHAHASLEICRRSLGNDHPKTLRAMNNTAAYLHRIGQFTESESLYREALQRRRRVLGNDDPETLSTIYNLGYLLWMQGKLAEAEPLCREAMDGCRKLHGNDHEETLRAMTNLAGILFASGKRPEGESLFLEALKISRRVRGDDHPTTMFAMNNVGWILLLNGNVTEAQNLLSEALRRRRTVLGDDHPETISSLFNLGSLFEKQENFFEAEPLFAEVYQRILVSQMPPPHVAEAISHYGPCLVKLGRYTEAEQPLREAERRLRETGQSRTENMHRVMSALAELCDQTNRAEEAVKWRADVAKLQAATQPSPGHDTQPTTAPNT